MEENKKGVGNEEQVNKIRVFYLWILKLKVIGLMVFTRKGTRGTVKRSFLDKREEQLSHQI